MDAADHDHDAMAFVVQLGAALVCSGNAADDVERSLLRVANGLGLDDIDIVVLPTAVLLQVGDGPHAVNRLGAFRRTSLRLDQIGAIDELAKAAGAGRLDATAAISRLDVVLASRPPMRRLVRILGMGVLSTGFSLLLQPTAEGVLIAFVMGLFVGLLRVIDLPRLQALVPVMATFVVSLVVFELTGQYGFDNPIRLLIPPLLMFLPGAALTTGTMELASGDTVSGASRLVEGVVTLLLLAFGIVAAAELADIPDTELVDRPVQQLGWVAPLLGLVVIVLGHHLHTCAPRRALPWILLVSSAAFAAQAAGAAAVSPELSGFFGAVVMTPLSLWLSRRPNGPPETMLFLPAFWVLVPGATGLIGITQAVGVGGLQPGAFNDTAVTVVAITLGTLLGAAFWYQGTDLFDLARQEFERTTDRFRRRS